MCQRQILEWQILFPYKVYKFYLTLIFYSFIFLYKQGDLMGEEVKGQRRDFEMGGKGAGHNL